MIRTLIPWLLAGLSLPALAQPARPADPTDPAAKVPPVQHRSALAGYRKAGEFEVGSWQGVNERVNRIGGWRTYAREAQAPAVPAAPASTPPGHRH